MSLTADWTALNVRRAEDVTLGVTKVLRALSGCLYLYLLLGSLGFLFFNTHILFHGHTITLCCFCLQSLKRNRVLKSDQLKG